MPSQIWSGGGMVDIPVLGTGAERRAGSSPAPITNNPKKVNKRKK